MNRRAPSRTTLRPRRLGDAARADLILTAALTDPDLYRGRMMAMLLNEIRYTNTESSMPGNLSLDTGELGPPSMFGAGEYAKDGLLAVTEYLERTAWYYRMVDMVADAMAHASVESRFGRLPAADSELNGDYTAGARAARQHDR